MMTMTMIMMMMMKMIMMMMMGLFTLPPTILRPSRVADEVVNESCLGWILSTSTSKRVLFCNKVTEGSLTSHLWAILMEKLMNWDWFVKFRERITESYLDDPIDLTQITKQTEYVNRGVITVHIRWLSLRADRKMAWGWGYPSKEFNFFWFQSLHITIEGPNGFASFVTIAR